MMANWGVSIRKGISSIRGSVFDLIFPRKCHGCEKAYLGEDEHFWCSSCRTRIEWIRSPLCTLCGKPYPKNPSGSDHYCGECLTSTFHFDRARSAAVHSGIVRDCIHALKFGGRLHHVPSLVQLLQPGCASGPRIGQTPWACCAIRRARPKAVDRTPNATESRRAAGKCQKCFSGGFTGSHQRGQDSACG